LPLNKRRNFGRYAAMPLTIVALRTQCPSRNSNVQIASYCRPTSGIKQLLLWSMTA
jgi:hypothetical protein